MSSSSSSVVATLEPIHRDKEILSVSRRPTLSVLRGKNLELGRNHTTGIVYTGISRNAATVSWHNDQLWIEPRSSHSAIYVNDQRALQQQPLSNGDRVSLFLKDYVYRVKLVETATDATDATDAGNDASSSTTTAITPAQNVHLQQASEEVMCAVCMEIFVNTTAVVPCGHLFCAECCKDLQECPQCRLKIEQRLPIRTVDSFLSKLVLSNAVFCPHDAQHYAKTALSEMQTTAAAAAAAAAAVPSPAKRARVSHPTAPVVSVDLTTPQQGDTAEDAICID